MPEPRRLAGLVLLALVAGVALGLFSGFGDRLPPDTALHVVVALANAAGPWLVIAFTVGALAGAPLAGAITAACALFVAVAVYYLTIYAGGNTVADLLRSAGLWIGASAVVGPLLGAAGGKWARPRRSFDRIGAVALLAGTLAAEAIVRLIRVEAWTGLDLARTDILVGLVELGVAALIPTVLLSRGERGRGYLVAAIATAGGILLGVAALAVIHWAKQG